MTQKSQNFRLPDWILPWQPTDRQGPRGPTTTETELERRRERREAEGAVRATDRQGPHGMTIKETELERRREKGSRRGQFKTRSTAVTQKGQQKQRQHANTVL